MARIGVLVNGANGRMGREVIKAVLGDPGLELVAAVDRTGAGTDAALLAGLPPCGKVVSNDLAQAIEAFRPEVMVDFTQPQAVLGNVQTALSRQVAAVVGTTGMGEPELAEIREWTAQYHTSCVVAPNFAIGALLMMRFAREAARFMPHVEIIELHHDQKLDAPSGTALKTAELIREERKKMLQGHPLEKEIISGARGAEYEGMRLHSVRLPGLVAHQEVIFGSVGQTLRIRHDSISRESFMPGVLAAVHRIRSVNGLVYGLENLIF